MLRNFGQSFQSVLKVFEIHPHFISLVQCTLCGVTPQVKNVSTSFIVTHGYA